MKTNCRFCGSEMIAKKIEVKKVAGEPPEFEVLRHIGAIFHSDVCENPDCQSELQYECDEFDRARKGE